MIDRKEEELGKREGGEELGGTGRGNCNHDILCKEKKTTLNKRKKINRG